MSSASSQDAGPAAAASARAPPLRRLTRARCVTAGGALLVAAIASALFFHRLGESSLHGDEALHAQVARESAERDGWLPPTYSGRPYVNKPPLKILAVAWIFGRFGVSELHARVLDAAFGVATAVVVFLFGRRLWGAAAGALAALLLITAEHYVFAHGVRAGVQDSALVLATTLTLALYFLYRERRRGGGRRGWPLLLSAGIAAGCGGLVKGPVIGLALAVVAAWELAPLLRGRRPRLAGLGVLTVLAAAPYLAWLAAANEWTGGRLGRLLYQELVVRNTAGLDPGHLHGPLFYPSVLGDDFGLWLLALLPALVALTRWRAPQAPALATAPDEAARDRRAVSFVGLWAALLLAIPSLSPSKLSWYIYPAYPALALLCARGTAEAVRRAGRSRLLAAALVALVAFGLWQRVDSVRERAGREPWVIPAHRYARAIADLPAFLLIVEPHPGYRPWDLFYLRPLGTRRRRLPPAIMRPIPNVCRFLVRGSREVPPGVVIERQPEFAARPLGDGGEPRGFLLDLDACIPVWI